MVIAVATLLAAGPLSTEAQRPPVDTSGWPSVRLVAHTSLPSLLLGHESSLTSVHAEVVLRSGWSPFAGMAALHLTSGGGCPTSLAASCAAVRPPWSIIAGANRRLLMPDPNADRDQRVVPYFGGTVAVPMRADPRLPRAWVQGGADVRLADGWSLRLEAQARSSDVAPLLAAFGLRIAVP